MSDSAPRFEAGTTRLFTVAYSTQPSTPYHAVYASSSTIYPQSMMLVSCAGASASSTIQYYRHFTMPSTPGFYVSEWVGSFTTGPDKVRDVFQVVVTG